MTKSPEFFRLQGRLTLFILTNRFDAAGFIPSVRGVTVGNTHETSARVVDVDFITREDAYEAALEYKQRLEAVETDCARVLKSIPGVGGVIVKGVRTGLTPDHVKASPQYKAAKKQYDAAFNALRDYNGVFCKLFAHEYQAERRAKEIPNA